MPHRPTVPERERAARRPGRATARPASRGLLGATVAGATAAVVAGPLARPALAHGAAIPAEPTAASLLLGWTFPPTVAVPLVAGLVGYLLLVRRVDAAHPERPVPRSQVAAFLGGLGAIAVALMSGIEAYDTTLFSVHMVQHLLLAFVAAPLLALGAPVTLLLRAASPAVRSRAILPVLHSSPVRLLAFPVVAWLLFAGVMWGSHFSPLFDAALEDPLVHDLEHALFLGSALLFWWPAVGRDPVPWRMRPPARVAYLLLQMPQNTFLSVAILWAATPLYPHYATLGRAWGPSVLEDQQLAGALMWLVGDAAFLVAGLGVLAAWLRSEERDAPRREAQVDRERAAIRERERRLAERLAAERAGPGDPAAAQAAVDPAAGPQPGTGASR